MKMVRAAGVAVALVMVGVIGWAWSQSAIGDDFSVISDRPWGVVSLVDLYLGLALAAVWVVYREASGLRAAAWVLALIVLGNLALGAYVAVAAAQAIRRGEVEVFFRGGHAIASN